MKLPFSIYLLDATCMVFFKNFWAKTRDMIKTTLCVLVNHFFSRDKENKEVYWTKQEKKHRFSRIWALK